jgi:protease I
MDLGLKGRHVAILSAEGVDGAQVAGVRSALTGAGAVADVLGLRSGNLSAQANDALVVDRTLDECHTADFDALVITGGKNAIDALRTQPKAVQFVREFMAADKPVAAVAEGIALLAAADVAAGRAVAADARLADELRQAGAEIVDAPVHVDDKLITARDGGDLEALNTAVLREFANRVDEARVDQLSEQSFPASDPPPGPLAVGGEGASKAPHLDPRRPAADRGEDRRGARS